MNGWRGLRAERKEEWEEGEAPGVFVCGVQMMRRFPKSCQRPAIAKLASDRLEIVGAPPCCLPTCTTTTLIKRQVLGEASRSNLST